MICHHYKCVFIHIPKNAGQSIEHVFLALLNLNWETRAPLLLRYNDRPELGPPRLAHLKAHEYVLYKYMTQEQFDSYFKFSFVRNPYDRAVSIYKHFGFSERCGFKKFVMKKLPNELWNNKYWFVGPQSEFLYDKNGETKVNFVGRFENLQNDFNYICKQIGLPPTEVPHINKSEKKKLKLALTPKQIAKWLLQIRGRAIPKFRSYWDYYDDESREYVAELYKTDIELFKYRFNECAAIKK